MVKGIIETSQNGPGMKYEVPIERRINTIRGLFQGFYQHIDKPVIFNTNRAWTLLTAQMNAIYPDSKFIVCVRDISRIIDSFETIHRNNPLVTNTATGGVEGTVYSRAESLMTNEGIIGFPLLGIKQAIMSNEQHKLFIVEYDELTQRPDLVIKSLYKFLDEPMFDHDFNNIHGEWDEYDKEIGVPMHKLHSRVQYRPRKFIIPPDIIQRYSNMEVWR
jgi:sulfotransferase